MRTPLCDAYGIEYPIFAFTHCRDVVAAVSKAGGLGVLGAVGFSAEQLEIELDWIDEHVDGKPYGVDTVMPQKIVDVHGSTPDDIVEQIRSMIDAAHWNYVDELMERFEIASLPEGQTGHGVIGWTDDVAHRHVEVALAHPIKLIANALGSPPKDVIDQAHAHGVKVAALAGKAVHAQRHVQNGVDVVVAQGYEAGGHTGEIATMVLVPEVVDA
ncbi:MAG TPA: nitronate monooxygenase, partial [Acidimicrobiia bacterium]